MNYRKSEIKYAWGISPEDLEKEISEGWAVIAMHPFGSPEEGFQVMAILRRPLPEEAERALKEEGVAV